MAAPALCGIQEGLKPVLLEARARVMTAAIYFAASTTTLITKFRNGCIRVKMNLMIRAVAMVAAASVAVACSGAMTPKTEAPRTLTAYSVGNLGRLVLSEHGTFKKLNDAPRNPGSARFAERQAAAHARGVWLTDELNAHVVVARGRGLGTGRSSPQQAASVRSRSAQSIPNQCATCDPGGGGGGTGGGTPVTPFDDNGGDYPYDMEADYPDGTSVLFEEFLGVNGEQYLTTLNSTGIYQIWNVTNGTAPPRPQPTEFPTCAMSMDGANMVVFTAPCPNKIPKWACPYLGGGGGLLAKWATAAATKNSQAGDVAGLAVGLSLAKFCNEFTFSPRPGSDRLRLSMIVDIRDPKSWPLGEPG